MDIIKHRSYIGPQERYDINGASQFNLLVSLGLREYHSVLDVGCGSLSLGRLLIPYLSEGNYFGIEPNKWLIEEVKKKELGNILKKRKATFVFNNSFEINGLFDYIIADSIITHCSPDKIRNFFSNLKNNISDKTVFIVSFAQEPYHGDKNLENDKDWEILKELLETQQSHSLIDGWVYPEMFCYSDKYMKKIIKETGLDCDIMSWEHIYKKKWLKIIKEKGVSK